MTSKNYLIAFDFDKTIAETFKSAPGIIDVNQAFNLAVKDVFGDNGLALYHRQGGLRNRATSELVHDMLSEDATLLTEHALCFFESNRQNLQSVVSEGKGVSLNLNSQNATNIMGEILVRQKLRHLLPQVRLYADGSIWPEPTKGFISMWKTMQELKRSGLMLDLAVISSGHDLFINKTFDLWGISQADILVTEDDIRGLELPARMDLRVKPGTLSLSLAHKQWRKKQGIQDHKSYIDAPFLQRDRIVYFGDDPLKDGGLARSQGIMFGHFDHDVMGINSLKRRGDFQYDDWRAVGDMFFNYSHLLREGVSLRQFFVSAGGSKEAIRFAGKER